MLGKVQPGEGDISSSQVRGTVVVVTTTENGQMEWPFSRVTGGRGQVRKFKNIGAQHV